MPPPITVPASPLDRVIVARSADLIKDFAPGLDLAAVTAAVADRGAGFTGELADFGIMHDIFGHEAITDPWTRTLRILDTETEESVPEAVRLAKGRSQQVGNTVTAWVDVLVTRRLPPPLEPSPSPSPLSSSPRAASRTVRYSRTARDASSAFGQAIGWSPAARFFLSTSALIRLASIEGRPISE